MKKRWFWTATAVLTAADQLLKYSAEQNLEKGEERPLTDRIVFRRVENRGLCLNLLSEKPELVKGLSAGAAGCVTVLQAAALLRKRGLWTNMGLALLTAGAWSNTFDRFARGYVVDYIGVRSGNKKLTDLTYNLGDFLIAAGTLILSLAVLFSPGSRKQRGKAEAAIKDDL